MAAHQSDIEKDIGTLTISQISERSSSSRKSHDGSTIIVSHDEVQESTDGEPQCFTDTATPLYRWTVVVLVSSFYLLANFCIGSIAPAVPSILSEFVTDASSREFYQSLIVTIWALGQAVGPLFMGPLSERYGRLPVQHVSTGLFIIFAVAGGFSNSIQAIVAFRFLMALTTTSSALNGPIVGDLFPPHRQTRPMALNQFFSVLGIALGPVGGGLVTEARGWRWAFWLVAILAVLVELPLLIVYRESYRPRIKGLTRQPILPSVLRPFRMLFMSPVVALVSVYVSITYSFGYLILATVVEVFASAYGFQERATSFTYIGFAIGMGSGVLLYVLLTEQSAKTSTRRHNSTNQPIKVEPETYLPPMVVGGVLMSLGLLVYGWSAQRRAPWPAAFLSTGIYSAGACISQVVSNNYLVGSFGRYAASATAGSMMLRFVASALIPLAGPPLYAALGLGWGNSLLAFVALALVPSPVLMIRYGKRLRGVGPFRAEVLKTTL